MAKRQHNQEKVQSRRTVRFLFNLWRVSPVLTWLMIGTQVIATVISNIIAPLFVSRLITSIVRGTATMHSSVWLIVGYIASFVVGDIIMLRLTIALAFITESRMQKRVLQQVMSNQLDKSTDFHANHMSGGIVSDNTKLNSSIMRFWDTIIFQATPIAATLAGACIVLSFFVWQFAVALFILSLMVTVLIMRSQNSIAPISREVSRKSSAITAYFSDAIANIGVVKAYAGSAYERRAYNRKLDDWHKADLREMKGVLLITTWFNILLTSMNSIAFVGAILATQYHIVQIGIVYLMIVYTLSAVSQLWQVTNITRNYLRIVGDAGPMIAMLDEPIELTDPASPEAVRIVRGRIEFDHVVFQHAGAGDALFNNLNLQIKPGEKVGLVGRSGSGKTTLTRLLLRFSDVQDGTVAIDGQNIAAITQDDLRRHIAYVPQEPLLFHRSIEENIGYGQPDADEATIEAIAKLAHAHEFVKDLPAGYGTLVGERGVKLSGGQRQRIAIARAMLKNAPILVLDEATSALDSESEVLIQDALWKLMEGRTAIVIAHRLSTIQKMDRIIVMDNGKIVEQGTHKELLRSGGTYAKLWAHQSGGFMED